MELIGLLTEEPLARLAVKNKIKSFIAPDLYRDLDDFIKDNPTFEDFKRRAKFNEAYRRALNWDTHSLTEDEYQQILSELKAELEEKMKIEKDKINTVTANGKEVSTYKKDDGSVIAVDNSYSDKPITDQLEDIQKKYSRFRQDGNTNTEELMEFAQEEIKPEPAFQVVDEVNEASLNSTDAEIAGVAKAYQAQADGEVSVNLEDGLLLDQGTVLEIKSTDEGYAIAAPDATVGEEQAGDTLEADTPVLEKAKQKTLKRNPFKQAGFSDAILLALLTGMFIGLALLNIYIKTI